MNQMQLPDRALDARLDDFLSVCVATAEQALASGLPEDLTGALTSIAARARDLSAVSRARERRAFTSRWTGPTAPR
jgi:hypothetical protein